MKYMYINWLEKKGRNASLFVRAIPFEKLGEGMSRLDFLTSPTGISKFLGKPTRGIAIFFIASPTESTKRLGIPLPALFAYPPLFLYMNNG